MSRETNVARLIEDGITRVSEETGSRKNRKLTQEFRRTASRFPGSQSKLDKFHLNLQVQVQSETVLESSWMVKKIQNLTRKVPDWSSSWRSGCYSEKVALRKNHWLWSSSWWTTIQPKAWSLVSNEKKTSFFLGAGLISSPGIFFCNWYTLLRIPLLLRMISQNFERFSLLQGKMHSKT